MMRFVKIFSFEFGYQIRKGLPWLVFSVVLALCFLMARDSALADAMYEDFFANSSFAITNTTVIGTLLWLVIAAAIGGEAAARDITTGMHPLTYTVNVSKAEYLGGRFLAAFVLNALILLAVQLGIFFGVYSPGVSPSAIGPFRLAAYLNAYAYISLPNAFIATALQFFLAERSGRPMAGYLGSFLLVFMGFFVASLLLFKKALGTLLDPIGIRFVVEDLAHSWTTVERNERLLGLEGVVLSNRLVWVIIGIAILITTYLFFRFEHRTGISWRRRNPLGQAEKSGLACESEPVSLRIGFLSPHPSNFIGEIKKVLAVAWSSFCMIALSWGGRFLLIVIPLLSVAVVVDQMVSLGTPLVPTTPRVLAELTAPLSAEMSRWVVIPPLIIFFVGELMWREREARLHEITDTMPQSEWVPFVGKLMGLALVLALFMTAQMASGIIAQVILEYHEFQVPLYLKTLFGLQFPDYLLFAVPAFAVHALVNQKYVGHLLAMMVYAFIVLLSTVLGIEHNLLVYTAGPGWAYTELKGFGETIKPWLWFKLYWTGWALLLAVVTRLFWIRGKEKELAVRIQLARRRLTAGTTTIAFIAAGFILLVGGFIFYNTNILNKFFTTSQIKGRSAEYERRYRKFENSPQPLLTDANLQVEIHPAQRTVDIAGSYLMVNTTLHPIDSIHIALPTAAEPRTLGFDRNAILAIDDRAHSFQVHVLKNPLVPGDSVRLDFELRIERRGFGNRGIDPSITPISSAVASVSWLPFIGYQRQRELISASDRREYGLDPRPIISSLYALEEREPVSRGGGVQFEAVVATDYGQVAVAPGALINKWTKDGRNYFHYRTSAPIGTVWYFFSANYATRDEQWKPPADSGAQAVAIHIFHNPKHSAYIDRLVRSVRASLDYYSEQFGRYPYDHLTIVAHPGAPGTSAHAEASTISYGEGFPLWMPTHENESLDFPFAIMAHEMAHQWTIPYARVEGAPFLSEGLAWYSAMQVVKASRGDAQLRRLHAFMREPYPIAPIRRGEPLLRALDPYLSYRKGPFAMYALSEYIGSNRVNGAIRRLLEAHELTNSPLATTLDLYRELKIVTPDSLQYLLHDLFEVNTYWQLKTQRVEAERNQDGRWQVSLEVNARKVVIDSAGVEREIPMNDWIDVGVFGTGSALSEQLYLRKHRIRSGKQTIKVIVSEKPDHAGIDPYNLIDLETLEAPDNVIIIKLKE
jgi:ABC-2 type transport system permease protein